MKIRNVLGCCSFLPILLLLSIIGPAGSFALDIKGVIDSDSRWTTASSPVYLTGDLRIAHGATLTIDPGVDVIFQPRPDTARGYNLTVEGTLVARGEATLPIVFTALDRELPWGAIIFRDSSTDWDASASTGSILSYCIVEYGGNDADDAAMIICENAMPRIAGNAIRFSSTAGIAAFAGEGAVSLSGNIQVIDNQIYNNPSGIVLSAEGGLIAGNYFLNNGRAVSVRTRSNGLELRENTITGVSGELFGSGIQLELDETAGGITAFHWVQTGGPTVVLENPESARPSFTAPDPGNGIYTLVFDLTVTGSNALQATQSVDVTVIGANEPPVAVAGGDQNVRLSTSPTANVVVSLSGVGSYDPFIGIAGYRWQQESGRPVNLETPNSVTSTFVVPASVAAGEQMTFRLTVIDRGGLQSSDTVKVRFYQNNVYPVAAAGTDVSAVQGQTVSLDGSGSRDPDGGITAYQWIQTGGTPVTLFNINTAKPFFVAPAVDENGATLTFALGVLDTGGLTDSDIVVVEVKGATTADAGEDQTVSAGDRVTLDGTGSIDLDAVADVDIRANTFRSDNAAAGLMAISALEGARYGLHVSGNNLEFADEAGYAVFLYDWADASLPVDMTGNWWGTGDPATIDALIYDQSDDLQLPAVDYEPFATQIIEGAGSGLAYPPLADAGPDLETAVDQSVTLDGTNSYDPDGIGVFLWQQVEGPTVSVKDPQSPITTFVAPAGGTDGQLLRFSLTMTTGGAFSHIDEVSVTVTPDEAVPLVEVGGGCFIQSTTSRLPDNNEMNAMMIALFVGTLFALGGFLLQRKPWTFFLVCLSILALCAVQPVHAGFFAVGGGDGGDAEQYNVTLETGAKDIAAGKADLLFAVGIPFIPHGDNNLPDNTIAFPCPNNDCQPIGDVRKGTEVGFYGKLGIEIGSSNLYLNVIGGFTVYTESQLVHSPGSGATYEQSSDTTIEPLYGGGLSYFPDYLEWPILIQVDYDITRGVTGTIGWYW